MIKLNAGRRGRRLLLILILSLAVLSACGSGAAQNGAELVREKYRTLETIKLSAEITADFGDRVSVYVISYELSQGTGIITIEKPIEIAGITATIRDGGSTLEYDGLILETGKLAGTALTPIDAVPTMLATWAGGYMTDAGTERRKGIRCYRLTYSQTIDNAVVEQQAWFDIDTLMPLYAETLIDGRLVISCEFSE
jgi:outer membrane lipoprotein-sorting protein